MEALSYCQLMERYIALAAENAGLKSSREILAKNTLEACNAIASAGFSHEAIMRGLYASTGNGNKYPKPITTLVDEALRDFQTPATDAFLAEVRAQGVEMAACALDDVNQFNYANMLDDLAQKLRQDANTAELVAAGIITKVGE